MTPLSRQVSVLVLLALGGCNRVAANTDLERMIDQAKFEAYEADYAIGHDADDSTEHSASDRGVMRHPPAGTVPRERIVDPSLDATLSPGGPYRQRVPLVVDRSLLERGRDRFERYCGACHGINGYGNLPVIENMALRPAPSLHNSDIVAQPVGRIYSTITHGYGLMPSYAYELDPRDRWAVVAYLQALWLSEGVALAELPPAVEARARKQLP